MAKELVKPERNTLQVSYQDIEKYNSNLAIIIVSEYYRSVRKKYIVFSFKTSFSLQGLPIPVPSCVQLCTGQS